MSRVRNPILAGALALSFSLGGAGSVAAQTQVSLEFGWPDDLSGTAEFTFQRSRVNGASQQELSGEGRTRITVSPMSGNLLLAFDDTEVDLDGAGNQGPQARIDALITEVTRQLPDYLVSRDGEFVRLADPAGFRKTVHRAVEGLAAGLSPEIMAQVRPTLDSVLSDTQLTSLVEADWNIEVGSWVGAVLEPGRPLHTSDFQSVPMLGDAPMPVRVTYTLIGRAACAAPNGCVELESRSVMDSPEAAEAVAAFFRQMDPTGTADIRVTNFRIESVSRMISDPDTLVPYRSSMRRSSTLDVIASGQPLPIRETEQQTVVYEYAR